MNFPIYYSILLVISFILLLIIFYSNYKFNISQFIGKLNKKLYIISSIICIISFLLTYYYISIKKDFTKNETIFIFVEILIIILATCGWIIFSTQKTDHSIFFFNILFLIILSIANGYLLYTIYNINEIKYKILHIISIISVAYLLFHHIFIDLILWNYFHYYLRK
jgi:hypothetical protein